MPLESLPNKGLFELQALPGAPMQVRVGLLADGRKKVGVFVKLKNSARNCSIIRSPKVVFLKKDTSAFFEPGPRATRRAESPNSWIGAPVALSTVPGTAERRRIEVAVDARVVEHHRLPSHAISHVEGIEDGRQHIGANVGWESRRAE